MGEVPAPAPKPPVPDRLAGRVAIVTGGASGIGRAITVRLLGEGARVVVGDLTPERADDLVAEHGERLVAQRADVSDEDDVAGLVATAVDRLGRLDILCNNAGFGGALGPITETSVADFDLTFDVLVRSVFLGIKHATPVLAADGGGAVINTASIAARRAGWAPHLYTAAKAAVLSLTETAALELGALGVRCNAVSPGLIATPLYAGHPDSDAERIEKARQASHERQPLGRVGEPEDIAAAVAFLASDDAEWITGQQLIVDGGITAGPTWDDFPAPYKMVRPIRHHRPPGR